MDVSGIAAAATQLSQNRTANDVQIAVLKKAMDIQAQGALQLVQAATAQSAQSVSNNPPHLGNAIDTFA